MRKTHLLSMMLVVVLVFSTTFTWAGNTETQIDKTIEETVPTYTYAFKVNSSFSILSGVANCGIDFFLSSGKTLDYIFVTAKVKKSTGTTVKTFEEKLYPKSNPISWRDTYKLTSRGTYYIDFTIKCYKGGVVKETIKIQSVKKVY